MAAQASSSRLRPSSSTLVAAYTSSREYKVSRNALTLARAVSTDTCASNPAEHSSFTAPELFSEEAAVMAPEAMEKVAHLHT